AQLEEAEGTVAPADGDGESRGLETGLADRRRDRPTDQRLLAERLARGEDELVPLGIEEQEGERLGARDALHRLQHGAHELAHVEGRSHGAQARVELLELAESIGEAAVAGHGGASIAGA